MNDLNRLYKKIRKKLYLGVSDTTIYRIVDECADRTKRLGIDMKELLHDDVSVYVNDETFEIDIIQKSDLGIFWSFDLNTGELVGT